MAIRQLDENCDDCGVAIKHFHFYKTKTLCNICYRKYFLIITSVPQIYSEPITATVAFSLGLTKTQKKLLDDRVEYLFPNKKNYRTVYLRGLILGDIHNWKKREKEEREETEEEKKKKGDNVS